MGALGVLGVLGVRVDLGTFAVAVLGALAAVDLVFGLEGLVVVLVVAALAIAVLGVLVAVERVERLVEDLVVARRVVLGVGEEVAWGVAEEVGAVFLARLVDKPSIDLFEFIVYNYNMKVTKITKKQQALLDFLEDFTEEKGYSPSYREIQAGLGLSSVSAVAEHIDNMVSKGILKKVPGAARSLEVLDFRHTETVELFRARLSDCSDEERSVLLAAADLLGLDLEHEVKKKDEEMEGGEE